MSIHAHIKELRTRLFVVAAVFLIMSMLVYTFRDTVIDLLLSPLNGEKLSYLTPGGGFTFIIAIVMWGGLALTLPFLIYNIYGFIAPALPPRAQRKSFLVITASFFLMCAGAAFGYIYAIPGAMRFLLTFADTYVTANLTADSYLNFVLVYTVGLGVLFQIPLLMIAVNWITPLKPRKLLGFERYVIVAAFVVAALITPTPDAVNQTIIAAPVVAMYQVGFIAVAISQRQMRKHEKRALKLARVHEHRLAKTRVGRSTLRYYYIDELMSRRTLVTTTEPTQQPEVASPRPVDGMKSRSMPRTSLARTIAPKAPTRREVLLEAQRRAARQGRQHRVDGVGRRYQSEV